MGNNIITVQLSYSMLGAHKWIIFVPHVNLSCFKDLRRSRMIPLPQSIQTYGEFCLVDVDGNIKYYVGFKNMLNGIELIFIAIQINHNPKHFWNIYKFKHIMNNGFNSRRMNMKNKKTTIYSLRPNGFLVRGLNSYNYRANEVLRKMK